MRKGFTLIEILVVTTIISLLATATFVSYGSVSKNSRDAKRKADIEQIRASLEMYRSNNGVYPTAAAGAGMAFGTGSITDASSNTYLSKIPQDPSSKYSYYYTVVNGDYVLGSYLENTTGASCSVGPYSCAGSGGSSDSYLPFTRPVYAQIGNGATATPTPGASGSSCNYCIGPYGSR